MIPKSPRARADVFRLHAERERSMVSFRRTVWNLAWWYLQGYRHFTYWNPATGAVRAEIGKEKGSVPFWGQELLRHTDRVQSLLASRDLRPLVGPETWSLGLHRQKAMAQVIADSVLDIRSLKRAQRNFAHHFAYLGCCGMGVTVLEGKSGAITTDFEVIHPTQIMPWPSVGKDPSRERGLMRERLVSLDWLKRKMGKKTLPLENMEWWEIPTGSEREDSLHPMGDMAGDLSAGSLVGGTRYPTLGAQVPTRDTRSDDLHEKVVRIREVWERGDDGTLDWYSVTSGEEEIRWEDYRETGEIAWCPIAFSNFIPNGTFHGSGMFDLCYSYSRELERLSEDLFRNVREMDRYPILVVPGGSINMRQIENAPGSGERMRYMLWNPELGERFNPTVLEPNNSGDIPGRTAMFAREALEAINPARDLIKEKGRVDSAVGLQMLQEKANETLTSPSSGLNQMMGDLYRSMVSQSLARMVLDGKKVRVTNLTLEMAGILIDENGEVSMGSDNPIPDLNSLHFDVREGQQRSPTILKQEGLEMIQAGVNDPDNFRIWCVRNNVPLPVDLGTEKSAVDTSILMLLRMFGDGQSPSPIPAWHTAHMANPAIQLKIVGEFLSSPIMQSASEEVVNEIQSYRQDLIMMLGMSLDNAVPLPEDVAMIEERSGPQGPAQGPPEQ